MDPLAPFFRSTTREDLHQIIELLADDPLGCQRESVSSPLLESEHSAFVAIDSDVSNEPVLATPDSKGVIGVLQSPFIPYLTYRGGWRDLTEGVRVAPNLTSSGIGEMLFF